MKNRYIYPAIIRFENGAYIVNFPDLDNCFTFGDNIENALDSARDVLELFLYDMEQDGVNIPESSELSTIKLNQNESIALIDVWMIPVRDKMENRSVKKTLTIPKWINDIGIEHNLNFSQILQAAIKERLDIK